MLTTIDKFARLTTLQHLAALDLSHNKLEAAPSPALPAVGNLRYVDVTGNPVIDGTHFFSLT